MPAATRPSVQATLDMITHEDLALGSRDCANITGDAFMAAVNLTAAIVDVERIDAEGAYGERGGLSATRRPAHDDHTRRHEWSSTRDRAGPSRRIHIWRRSARDDTA